MPPELFDVLKTFGPSALTGFIGFFAGRGRKKAELELVQQKNKSSEFKRINELLNEYQERYKEQQAETHDLKAELRDLKAELRTMQQERQTERERSQAEIHQLKTELAEARLENRLLRQELEQFKLQKGDYNHDV